MLLKCPVENIILTNAGRPMNFGRIFLIGRRRLAHEWWVNICIRRPINDGIDGWALAVKRPMAQASNLASCSHWPWVRLLFWRPWSILGCKLEADQQINKLNCWLTHMWSQDHTCDHNPHILTFNSRQLKLMFKYLVQLSNLTSITPIVAIVIRLTCLVSSCSRLQKVSKSSHSNHHAHSPLFQHWLMVHRFTMLNMIKGSLSWPCRPHCNVYSACLHHMPASKIYRGC